MMKRITFNKMRRAGTWETADKTLRLCHDGLCEWFNVPARCTSIDLCIASYSYFSKNWIDFDPRRMKAYVCNIWHRQVRTALGNAHMLPAVMFINKEGDTAHFEHHFALADVVVEFCAAQGTTVAYVWAEV